MHQVLYRKWRPKTFSEVCGQKHITDILSYEVEHGRTAHAYLFCGSRGTGKTTCAKLLAKAVNCEHPVHGEPCGECATCRGIDDGSVTDVVEMDAASNNGVDDIRRIRDEVVYSPSAAKYRVYIIDEVHMLSPSAFNALLKTLEEPPESVIFILATTELQKLPATIISRCRRFDFRRIGTRDIADRLLFISTAENIALDDDAALLLARLAQGGMRDAVSMLELCASSGSKVDTARVRETAGIAGRESCVRIAEAALDGRSDVIFTEIEALYASSKDIAAFWQELVSFYRDMLIAVRLPREEAVAYLDLTGEEYDETLATAKKFDFDTLYLHCSVLDDAYAAMQRNVVSKRLCAEFALLRLAEGHDSTPEGVSSRLSRLENEVRRLNSASARVHTAASDPPSENAPPADPVYDGSASPDTGVSPDKVAPVSSAPRHDAVNAPDVSANASDISANTSDISANTPDISANTPDISANTPQTVPPAEKKSSVSRVLPYWIEIVRKVENDDSMIGSLLNKSTACRSQDDSSVTIHVSSSFAAAMLDKQEVRRMLTDLLSAYDAVGRLTFTAAVAENGGGDSILDGIDAENVDFN